MCLSLVTLWLVSGLVDAAQSCNKNAECYRFFTLRSYCCSTRCCTWFELAYKTWFSAGLGYEPPTVLTVIIMALAFVAGSLFALYVCCMVCACRCLKRVARQKPAAFDRRKSKPNQDL